MPTSDSLWIPCHLRSLPRERWIEAAKHAATRNETNAEPGALEKIDEFEKKARESRREEGEQFADRLALDVNRRWPPGTRLTVEFLDDATPELRYRILWHMNAWATRANVRFVEAEDRGTVRITFARDGYWSYLGTDIELLEASQSTMNLQGFTMATPDREFIRIVRHEAGHTLGFPHEHMRQEIVDRLDEVKVKEEFMRTQNWDEEEVKKQILTPLERASILATSDTDEDSIMCYHIGGHLTRDGKPVLGGLDISESDYQFAAAHYPFGGSAR